MEHALHARNILKIYKSVAHLSCYQGLKEIYAYDMHIYINI